MYWATGHARALHVKSDHLVLSPLTPLSSGTPLSPQLPTFPPSPVQLYLPQASPTQPHNEQQHQHQHQQVARKASVSSVPSPAIVAWAPNPVTTLFAAISQSEITIWNIIPCVVTTKSSRTAESLEEHGAFFDLVWAAEGTSLAALTTKGFILIYDVRTPEGVEVFHFRFTGAHHYVAGPGQGSTGAPHAKLVFRTIVKMDSGVVTASGLPGKLLVSTEDPPALQSLSWTPDSQVGLVSSVLLDELGSFKRPEEEDREVPIVTRIVNNATFEFCGLISSDGRLSICRGITQRPSTKVPLTSSGSEPDVDHVQPGARASRRSVSSTAMHSWECLQLEDPSGVLDEHTNDHRRRLSSLPDCKCVDYNDTFGIAAVGVDSGDVYVYRLPEDANEEEADVLRFLFKLSLKNPLAGGSGPLPGPTSSIAWSSDGLALAVGYAHSGFAIWSVYGKLLSNTWLEAEVIPDNFQDKYVLGVQSLFWAAANHKLFMLHGPLSDAQDPYTTDQMFVLPLAKASVASFHSMENIRHCFLELDDKLMVYRGEDYNLMSIHPDTHLWSDIQYPTIYITDNWPIRYSSVNDTGHYVAVSGRRGVAHYNTISGRWKVFGNQQQEREFVCRGGLLWYKNVLVVACVTVESMQSQVRFYPRERNLDNSQMLCTEQLSAPVVCMSMTGMSLLVYTDENMLCHFAMEVQQDLLKLNVIRRVSFAGIILRPFTVRAISWFIEDPKIATASAWELGKSPLLVLMAGRLFTLKPFKQKGHVDIQYDFTPMSDCVEFFWTPGTSVSNLRNSIWACTRGGVKVWINVSLDDNHHGESRWRTKYADIPEKKLYFPSDYHPFTVLLDKGIFTAIEQDWSFRNSLDVASFKVSPKSNLFLHHILRHMLSEGLDDEAVVFARCFQHLSYFNHALEVLLHSVLEDEAEASVGYREDAVLPRLVRFLKSFPSFLDIVVQCARKTEMSEWEYLFGVVGNPKTLFEECMSSGQLKTAASYLIIIQTSGPFFITSKESMRLLEKALETEDFELCEDLIRFMRTIGGDEHFPSLESIRLNSISPNNCLGITSVGTE